LSALSELARAALRRSPEPRVTHASLASKLGLIRDMVSGDEAPRGPLYVNVDVTHRCNLKCHNCRWHSPLVEAPLSRPGMPRDFDPEQLRALCADLQDFGTRTLYFCGAGEPLLHPEIFELIEIAKAAGLEVVMYTNGVALRDDVSRTLIDLGLDVLRVSVGATTAAEYCEKHPAASAEEFKQILGAMERLAQLKTAADAALPLVELCHPIGHDNAGTLEGAFALARATGSERLHFSIVLDFGQASLTPFTLSSAERAQVCADLRRLARRYRGRSPATNIEDILLRYSLDEQVWERTPCYGGWFYSYVQTDGSVQVCQRSEEVIGSLADRPFQEIWYAPAYRDFRDRALSVEGLEALREKLHCNYCPYVLNNYKVHRAFRWLAPLRQRNGRHR